MRVLVVVGFISAALTLVNAASASSRSTLASSSSSQSNSTSVAPATSVDDCEQQFAAKLQNMCGTFMRPEQMIDLMHQSYEMYAIEGKTLPQIIEFYYANYRDLDFDADQVDTMTSVLTNVHEIVGGDAAFEALCGESMKVGMAFIKTDKAKVDAIINENKAANSRSAALAVCNEVAALSTPQKKVALEKRMFALIPDADKLAAIKKEVRRVTKLMSDSSD